MTLALLPLGLISIWQTSAVIREAETLSRASLLARTTEAAREERRLVQQGLGAAEGLASAVGTLSQEECTALMRRFVEENDEYVFAGFIPTNGLMTCSTSSEAVDFSGREQFERGIRREGPFVEISQQGTVSRQAVLILSQPVVADGELLGRVALSIPHGLARSADHVENDHKIASFNIEGDLIAASDPLDVAERFLPADMPVADLAGQDGRTFRALANDGRDRYFAVTTLVSDTLYLVGSWPVNSLPGTISSLQVVMPMLFPILMWFAGLGVAVLGVQHLVIRNIRELRSAMRQFALGDRDHIKLKLQNPPQEFEEAERAFNRMALLVSEAEARQEADLRDKEVLLKEVHHRVKNNLQLIASIMNMQMRRATGSETKKVLSGLQQRVRGLAMLHRTLYTSADVSTMDSKDLIDTVVADAESQLLEHKKKVVTDIASFPLYPDQAVPVSMLVSEALTNALKYADDTRPDEPIRVVLEEHGDDVARLLITNPVPPDTEQDISDFEVGLGSQLQKAFIRQLDGTTHSEIRDGLFIFDVTFTRRDFESPQDV